MPFLYIVILGLYSSLAFAQSIIPSSQPTCVQQCQPFIQAQQACAPDKGQQALYQSCFCQSGYLIGIKTNAANNICPDCPTADWNIIAGWYEGLCGGSAAVPPPAAGAGNGQNPPTGPPAATTTSTTSEDSSATTAGDAYLTSANNPANWTDASSWFRTHWKWVVMIAVLTLAFIAMGVIGSILYKRKSRSRQFGSNNTAPMRSTPAVDTAWAPSRHSVHDFGTPREQSPAPPMPMASNSGSRRHSRRLGKSPMSLE